LAQDRLFRDPRVTSAFRDARFSGVRNLAVNSLQTVRPLHSFRNSSFNLTRLDSTQQRQYRNFGSQLRQASRSRLAAEGNFGARGGRPSALSLARIPTGPSRHALSTGPAHAASALRSPAPFASGRHITTAPSGRNGPFPRETRGGPGP